MAQIRISGKDLGALAMADFCPRCLWLKMAVGRRLPFQVFPGIFSSLDKYQKAVTDRFFSLTGRLPPWYAGFGLVGVPIPAPHHSRFFLVDPATEIRLTGVPDELLRLPSGGLAILDNKTARHTDGQDALLPVYQVQLNAYALIANRIGLGPVERLGLVYHEPMTDAIPQDVGAYVGDDHFLMRFEPKFVAVPLDVGMVAPLLRRARAICDLAVAPEGREGCRDCRVLDGLVRAAGDAGAQRVATG